MLAIYLVPLLQIVSLLHLQSADVSRGELVSLSVLYRHGERTPFRVPEHLGASRWRYGHLDLGMLTLNGQHQHALMGSYLRERYQQFLPEKFNSSLVRIQSSDFDRTLASALSNSIAMFGTTSLPTVHTIPSRYDHLLSRDSLCPAYHIRLATIWRSLPTIRILSEFFKSKSYIQLRNKVPDVSKTNFFSMVDFLMLESANNSQHWLNRQPNLKRTLLSQVNWMFHIEVCDRIIQQLRVGILTNEIASNMKCAALIMLKKLYFGTNTGRMQQQIDQMLIDRSCISKPHNTFIYSAHDFTVGYLLSALGAPCNFGIPSFASAVLVELHAPSSISTFNDSYGIQDVFNMFSVDVIYLNNANNKGGYTPVPLYIQQNMTLCEFELLVAPIRRSNNKQCFESAKFHARLMEGIKITIYTFIVTIVSSIGTLAVTRKLSVQKRVIEVPTQS